MQLFLFLLALAFIVYVYRGRQDTTMAPKSIATEGSDLEAVDFYWRPG